MKKSIIIIILLAVVAILVGVLLFTKDDSEKNNTDITAEELYNKIAEKVNLPELIDRSSDDLDMRYGIDTNMTTSFKYMSNGTSYYVDTVAIFKVSDIDAKNSIKQSLENVLTSTQNSMKNYDAKEYAIAEKGEVYIKGDFVIFIMSPEITEIKNIINENI